MGIWDRIRGREDQQKPVRVAVVGIKDPHWLVYDKYGQNPAAAPLRASLPEALALVRERKIDAVESFMEGEPNLELARATVTAGLFCSITCPTRSQQVRELEDLARNNFGALRIRMLPFYYPPYAEMKRLVGDDAVGKPMALKLTVRQGRGAEQLNGRTPADWLRQREVSFLALGPWMFGPAERALGRLEQFHTGAGFASQLLVWKFSGVHQYGYLQVDFCPGLHVRTFTEPVHRAIELTGVGGIIFATRGEGQLLREPALMVRGKSTTTAFEMLDDDWRCCYTHLALETIAAVREGQKVRAEPLFAEQALQIIEMADPTGI